MIYWIEYRTPKGKILGKRVNAHTEKINNARGIAVKDIGYNPDVFGAIYLSKDSHHPVGIVFYDSRYNVHVWSDDKMRNVYFVNSDGVISKIKDE